MYITLIYIISIVGIVKTISTTLKMIFSVATLYDFKFFLLTEDFIKSIDIHTTKIRRSI